MEPVQGEVIYHAVQPDEKKANALNPEVVQLQNSQIEMTRFKEAIPKHFSYMVQKVQEEFSRHFPSLVGHILAENLEVRTMHETIIPVGNLTSEGGVFHRMEISNEPLLTLYLRRINGETPPPTFIMSDTDIVVNN